MELNILKIFIDRAGRVTDTQNLTLNQCSTNNRVHVYYESEYDFIEMAFRKPDGWLSDRVTLTFDVDEENNRYAYYDIDEDFTSFIMGGRNAILVGNIYFHSKVNGLAQVASLGNIRINVNYVDDSLVHTNYSEAYMNNINSQIGALQNDLNRFKTGDVIVGKAIADRKGNTIDIYYETKADALDKYDDLNQKKLDKSEIEDQTHRLEVLENSTGISGNRLNNIENSLALKEVQIETNKENIQNIINTTVLSTEFDEEIQKRVEAELKLQKQIDEISTSQNVKDMVGTRADLFSYDTSKLDVDDRVQVLSDAAYDNLSTIYRWDGTKWVYVGKYTSTSYSKTDIDAKLETLKLNIPNKITSSQNKLYLNKDSTQISGQTNTVEFKTINGTTIIGSGDINTDNTDSAFSDSSTRPVQNKLITAALSNKADKSQLTNLETTVSSKADKSELETKQNKLTAGSNVTITEDGVISVSSAIKFQKIESGELPEKGESNIIYLIKSTASEYTEYIWVDDKWESLGDARISLENYYTAAEVNTMLANKANQVDLNTLSNSVSANTVNIASKADAATTNQSIALLNNSVGTLNTAVNAKADKTELELYALKEEIPDVDTKQDILVSGQNIKTINGVSVLGYGDLLIADTEIVDLGNYVLKTDSDAALALKADKTELFDKNYDSLLNKPNLSIYATHTEVEDVRTYVDESIEAIPPTDLTNYYTKSEVDAAIENVDVSEELSNYYTKEETDNAISSHVPDLTGYATEVWVADQGYMKTVEAASIFAVKSDIPTIPGNVSAFNNDVGYLVDSDISHLETKDDAVSKLSEAKQYTDSEIDKVETTITNLIGGAPAAYDTLKEISDYIASDKSGASNMLSSINKNASDILTVKSSITSGDRETLSAAKEYAVTEDSKVLTAAKTYSKQYTDSEIDKVETLISDETTARNTAISELSSELNTTKTNLETSITNKILFKNWTV